MELAEIPMMLKHSVHLFHDGLSKSEYEKEIRDIGLMRDYNREDIVRLVRNRYATLQKTKKKSPDMHGLICNERGKGRRGGGARGKSGRGRGGRKSIRPYGGTQMLAVPCSGALPG